MLALVTDAAREIDLGPAGGSGSSGRRPPRHVTISWEPGAYRFVATGTSPHSIALNAPRPTQLAATGFSPADLVLAGAGACSAWDVVDILAKAREQLVDLEVRVEGRQDADAPYPFRDVSLHYVVTGRGLKEATIERAVRLSHERYCSAIASMRGAAEIGYTIEIRDAGPATQAPD